MRLTPYVIIIPTLTCWLCLTPFHISDRSVPEMRADVDGCVFSLGTVGGARGGSGVALLMGVLSERYWRVHRQQDSQVYYPPEYEH